MTESAAPQPPPRASRAPLVSLAIVLAVAAALVVYRDTLSRWFQPGQVQDTSHVDHSRHSHEAQAAESGIDYYTCPMHPSVKQKTPGKCPLCGMDLVPVMHESNAQGLVTITAEQRQRIGVRVEPATASPLVRTIRTLGRATYDESKLTDVTVKVSGYVVKLFANRTGQRVQKGQPLFSLYSPELYAAQQDFLLASRDPSAGLDGPGSERAKALGAAARKRLRLLDMRDDQIDALAAKGAPLDDITIVAPASGVVIEKDLIEGASFEAGMRLFRIGSLDRIWIEADVYESDLASVSVGQAAQITLDYLPGKSYAASVSYVYPALDPEKRTARVRLELKNADLELRPGMYASVLLERDLGVRLQVPVGAVVYTGPRRLIFVETEDGKFRPQEVQIGGETNGMYEVLSGLAAGERIATSGVFLIAAEARIRTAAKYWEKP